MCHLDNIDWSCFKEKLGILRFLTLIFGLLVMITVLTQQFYMASWINSTYLSIGSGNSAVRIGGDSQLVMLLNVPWFGLFGYIVTLIYISQLVWSGVLVLNMLSGSDPSVMKQIDGGVHGICGVASIFIDSWWFFLMIYTTYRIGFHGLDCYDSLEKTPKVLSEEALALNCRDRNLIFMAIVSWIFASAHGTVSCLLGYTVFKSISNETINVTEENESILVRPELKIETITATKSDTLQSMISAITKV